MKTDIVLIQDGADLGILNSEAPRAANVLSVQLASLEYAQLFGVDLAYFLNSEYKFQNASFKAYLVQRLLQHQINVVNVIETLEALFTNYTFGVGSSDNGTGLIA